jgi:hypothetical protein
MHTTPAFSITSAVRTAVSVCALLSLLRSRRASDEGD